MKDSETYSLLIDTYVKDQKEKMHLLCAIETVPCVRRKANWALRWCDADHTSFAERMIAFAPSAPSSGSRKEVSCGDYASQTSS